MNCLAPRVHSSELIHPCHAAELQKHQNNSHFKMVLAFYRIEREITEVTEASGDDEKAEEVTEDGSDDKLSHIPS
jgi:hypothetical protein